MSKERVSNGAILVVDDDPQALHSVSAVLRFAGMPDVIACSDSREVMAALAAHDVWATLLDLTMPHVSGQEVLARMSEEYPDIPVIVVTAANEVDIAVACMRGGAFDYMVKPVEDNRLLSGVRRALELCELRRQNNLLVQRIQTRELERPEAFKEIVTGNAVMLNIFKYMETVAPTGRPVLITGETGTGKELFAKAMHRLSGRSGDLVCVNVAGLDDTLFSDTLFGHLRGGFTGADEARLGMIAHAENGTLLLDEIGDLSLASQVKLLRLLQEGEYLPVGAARPAHSEARFVVATNRDLVQMQKDQRFRKDLYYRLHTHHIHVPPLRDRLDDLPLLVDHFLEQAAATLNKRKPAFPKELLALLGAYVFPGNVRELESMIFEAVTGHESKMMSLDPFRAYIRMSQEEAAGDADLILPIPGRFPTLKEASRFLVNEALRRASNNHTLAAELLGISRPALVKRLRKMEADEDDE
jgi:DNA-binding NtrC family response regulator